MSVGESYQADIQFDFHRFHISEHSRPCEAAETAQDIGCLDILRAGQVVWCSLSTLSVEAAQDIEC